MCEQQFIDRVNEFRNLISQLKEESNYYPEILLKESEDGNVHASTLVRIERGGVWYVVHCVQSAGSLVHFDKSTPLLMLIKNVHDIQNLYKITGKYEDIDSLQESEVDRLTKLIGYGKEEKTVMPTLVLKSEWMGG